MADDSGSQTVIVLTTSIVTLISGFLLGVYSVRGYLISPELYQESRANYEDPLDSDETDIEEEEMLLDHAPNWANGEEADRKQGLRATAAAAAAAAKGGKKPKKTGDETPTGPTVEDTGEECKLVLVVRTDLGMTKGEHTTYFFTLVKPISCPQAMLLTGRCLNLSPYRQDCSTMLPRYSCLLQDPLARGTKGRP